MFYRSSRHHLLSFQDQTYVFQTSRKTCQDRGLKLEDGTGRYGKHEDTQNINGRVMNPIHTSSLEKDRMIEMKCKNQCNVCLTLRASIHIVDHTGLWIHQSFHRAARTNVQIDRVHDHVKYKVRSFESIRDDNMCKEYAHHLNEYDDDHLYVLERFSCDLCWSLNVFFLWGVFHGVNVPTSRDRSRNSFVMVSQDL